MQKPLLSVWAVKLPRLKGGVIGPRTETCVNSGGSIALVPCVHQGNIHIKRQSGIWRVHNCIPLVGGNPPLNCGGSQTTLSEGRRYRTENGNLRKLGRIYRLGTVFAPRQYLYQKTAMGMERPEMYSFSRCKNRSYLCVPSNYPVSTEVVKGRERKPAQIWEDLSPWYRVCTKAIFISKGS